MKKEKILVALNNTEEIGRCPSLSADGRAGGRHAAKLSHDESGRLYGVRLFLSRPKRECAAAPAAEKRNGIKRNLIYFNYIRKKKE